MNCEAARSRLLALPDPSAVPAGLAEHVDTCSACQSWQQLLSRVDGAIIATAPPAYAGTAKKALLEKFGAPKLIVAKTGSSLKLKKPAPRAASTVQPAAPRQPLSERLARFWPAGIAAAVILVGVLIWTSLKNGKSDGQTVATAPPDPFLEKVVVAKVKLDTAPNATARLDVLDSLGNDIHAEARTLAMVMPGAEMDSLAAMYQKVVGEAMVAQARTLSFDEKRATLPNFVDSLIKTERDANNLALAAPQGSDQPLKEIAKSAKKGRIALAQMMQPVQPGQG
jgi:hypothetical protein